MKASAAMPKYETYKDSGIEWLGEIPAHWNTARFRNAFSFDKGLNITKDNLQEHGVLCVSYGEVHSKYGFELNPDKHVLKCVSDDYLMSSPKSLLHNGDFIFADTSEDIDGSGNFTQLVSDHQIFAGYHTVIARSVINANKRFLAYALDSVAYRNQIRKRVKGVKVYSITKGLLKDTVIWLPSEAEQTTIAHFLDQKTAQIDAAIAIKKQQIVLLKERKQILIQQAVTQGLDPTVPMKDSGVRWIGEIPAHWTIKKVKFLSNFITSGPRGWSDYFSDEGAIFLQSGNLDESMSIDLDGAVRVNPKSKAEGVRTRLQDDDVLVCITGAKTGKVSLAATDGQEIYINQHLCLIRPVKEIAPNYLALSLYSAVGKTYFFLRQYGIKEGLGLGDVKNALVLMPTDSEQYEIISYVKIESEKISNAIDLQQQQIEKLREYKTTLINSAVTGKIRVTPEMVEAPA